MRGKGHPITGHEGPEGEQKYSSTLSLTSALDGGGWSTPRPGRFTLGKTRYPLYRRLGGPQGRSRQVRKISPPPGFDPQTVQPVGSGYSGPLMVRGSVHNDVNKTAQRYPVCRRCRLLNVKHAEYPSINPLNAELNPICYLLALLAHDFLHVSRTRVKSLTLRLIMSYIYIYIYIYMEHLFLMFLDHTQRRSTFSRTPLDE